MRLSIASLLGLAVSGTLAAPRRAGYFDVERDFSHMGSAHAPRGLNATEGKKGVFYMNRIAPAESTLYIANADGTNVRQLLNHSVNEYHASWSPDGTWITFTSERLGNGNSDIWRAHPDGSGLEKLLSTPAVEDSVVLSPNGSQVAYVSTENDYTANIWVLDIATGSRYNLTNTEDVKGVSWSPDGYFMPKYSPDGEWIAFSSDRNTQWTGHGNGTGWEHTQELSVYVIRPNGSDFRQIATKAGYSLGSPNWSPDGSRLVYYEIMREFTWDAHRPEDINSTWSTIVSVDFATGLDRVEEVVDHALKLYPQYLSQDEIAYLIKGPVASEGLNYTSNRTAVSGLYRAPAWSPNGSLVIYEVADWSILPMDTELYSWDDEWDYRFTDVFPTLSKQGNKLAITQKQLGNSSIVSYNPNTTDETLVFDVFATGQVTEYESEEGLAGAFQPAWSPDGEWVAFGLGSWFQDRALATAWIYRATANGSYYEQLTDGTVNSGFPSYSPDGETLVFREWGNQFGLRLMNLTDFSYTILTTDWDNLPSFSPDGEKIVFTRRMNFTNYDVLTIRPNGTDLEVLTSSGANDAHAVWTADGRIMYSTGMYGFRCEATSYDDTFQPYGQVAIMNADGTNKTLLINSIWEDSMPLYVPNASLA